MFGFLDWLKEGISFFINVFETILDCLNPASDNFIIKQLLDGLKNLIIPSEEDLSEIKAQFSEKLAFITSIKTSITSLGDIMQNLKPVPSLSINIGATKHSAAQSVKIIDLSWYIPFKGIGDAVITGFAYVMFLWRMFLNIPGILNGAAGGVTSATSFYNSSTKGGNSK